MHMGDPVARDDGRPAKRIKIEAPPPHAIDCPEEQVHVRSPSSISLPRALSSSCAPDKSPGAIDVDGAILENVPGSRGQIFPVFEEIPSPLAPLPQSQLQRQHSPLPPGLPQPDSLHHLSIQHQRTSEHAHSPAGVVMASMPTGVDLRDPWSTGGGAGLFDASWKWPSVSSMPPSQMVVGLSPPAPNPRVNPFHLYPAPLPSRDPLEAPRLEQSSSALSATEFDLSPASPTRASLSSLPSSRQQKRPRWSLSGTGDSGLASLSLQPKGSASPKLSNDLLLVSPFKDCVGSFGEAHKRRFNRPFDGKVNGYIKFNWPKERDSRRQSIGRESPGSDSPNVAESVISCSDAADTPRSLLVPMGPSPAASITPISLLTEVDQSFDFTNFLYGPGASSAFDVTDVTGTDPMATTGGESSTELTSIGAPRKVPKLFGYEAQMDQIDRKFWTFYIRNWCPGRSVLLETNLWLKDFAQMHKSDGVRAAIQSLAGIYIYDYQPIDTIRKRVNERFSEAELRFSRLLNDPTTGHNETLANELITMAVILSMQDIVLTERRLRKPHNPRWLSGFKHGEIFLQATDHGARFWKRSNAQLSSLRISQSIIVGRAMILSQPMMKLPPPDTFDPEYETSRFGWLLYGTEQDMYQIHGGCGFSKKLLHMMSQITYCAARLQQDPGNIIVPTTTQYLHAELVQMRQWSPESKDWESAKAGPSVTDWVRSVPDGYIIGLSAEMTDVTAEAWRLTAIIYLQCRVLRIPRNHPSVLENLADLARCIRIMPTSGYQFTAQAPLFPVFLLGMLGTDSDHRNVSKHWFDEVVSTPVRSSVPPLYEVLQRIWQWIDVEIELPSTLELAEHIGLRHPWWEHLVREVDRREDEVLCLT